jgi:chitodextrinase
MRLSFNIMARYALAPERLAVAGTGRHRFGGAVWSGALLLLASGLAAPAAAAPSAEELAALSQINIRRAELGLGSLSHNADLEQAARGHANYLVVNDTSGHLQTSTAPGFTGSDPQARIVATYGTAAVTGEAISYGPSTGFDAAESLLQSIYGRFQIFSTRADEIGIGAVTNHPTHGAVFVVNSALRFAPPPFPSTWVGVYPYSGQAGVPRDARFPDTLPGHTRVGYPISYHVDQVKTLSVTAPNFTIRKVVGGVPGAALPATLLTSVTDPINTPPSAAALVPNAPLDYGAEYEVSFAGTSSGAPEIQTWRFTTAPPAPITFTPTQPYLAYNSSVYIEIAGGSGVFQATPSPTTLADVGFTGPRTLKVTSPASGQSAASGPVTITVTDDETHTAQVVVQVQPAIDADPDPFSFAPVTGAPLSTVVESASITVTGIGVPSAISVVGGEYSVNGGAYTSQSGAVMNGDTVRVHLLSAPSGSTTASATLAIGAVSATFDVTTLDTQAPSIPGGLAIGGVTANALTLSWNASSDNVGVAEYHVFRGGVFRASVTAPTLNFNDGGLTAATLYSYTVSACDAAGNCSAQSSSLPATTLDNLPPSPPSGLSVANLAANSLTLNWLAATDNVAVTAYRVYRNGAFRVTVAAPLLSFGDTALASATLYSYTVAACDAAGNCSAQSSSLPATTLDNVPPSLPSGLSITNLAANSLTLSWLSATDNVAVTAYRVYRDGVFHTTVAAPVLIFNDSGLAAVTLYTYSVAACDAAANCSALSSPIPATTLDNLPPSAPAGFTATAVGGTQINLAWSAATDNVGVTAYHVSRGGLYRATVLAPATSFSDTGLISAATYSYTVQACDAAGNCSAPGATASATTADTVAPIAPSGVAAVAAGQSRINLAWNAAFDNVAVTAYSVFRGGAFLVTVNAPTLALSDSGLAASTPYSYTVRACDAAGNCSTQSAAASATTLDPGQYSSAPVLEPAFNLIANSLDITLDVVALFGNQDTPVAGITESVLSVWKWNAVDQRWAFYSPQLTAAANVAYAASHTYDVLSLINPGEGYWVNSAMPIALPVQTGAGVNWDAISFAALPSGFNLITNADSLTPTLFNAAVTSPPPAPGVVPIDNFFTLWAWDAAAGNWYFYSPLLEASGGLAAVKAYADGKSYRHFQDYGKMLGVDVGFWVNKP